MNAHREIMRIFEAAGKRYRIPDIEAQRKIKRIERRQAELKKEIAVLMQDIARGGR